MFIVNVHNYSAKLTKNVFPEWLRANEEKGQTEKSRRDDMIIEKNFARARNFGFAEVTLVNAMASALTSAC
ncbi:MAG: hypothetical protein AYP45_03300 [Candidatus Brocadia carolinensis]|uniref:Uncharacterized protein n=1 Tax=Candidatus Brocadia carolinensis TaxID=1004156 RepID=A0A1V4AWH2_9BACT|nr:MAG: hypothetical protein AYP45_03300 [Candidatus Brocadia caroliniensis]